MAVPTLCGRCGHDRNKHRGVFVGPVADRGCNDHQRDDFGWKLGRCDCVGFVAATADDVLREPELPPLRVVNPPDV